MFGAFLHLTPLGVVYLMFLDVNAAVSNLPNGPQYFSEQDSDDPKETGQQNLSEQDSDDSEETINFNIIKLIMKVIYNLIIDVLLYPVLVISFCIRLCNQVHQLGFGEDLTEPLSLHYVFNNNDDKLHRSTLRNCIIPLHQNPLRGGPW